MAKRKPVMSTGDTFSKTIVASERAPMADNSTPAQVPPAKNNTKAAEMLSLLQSDYFDLQSLGLKVAIVARDGRLYATIEYPENVLDFRGGNIFLNGQNVVTGKA